MSGRRVAAVVIAPIVGVAAWLLVGGDEDPTIAPTATSVSPRDVASTPPPGPARERTRRAAEAAGADGVAAPRAEEAPARAFVVTVVSAADGRPVEGALVRTVTWDGDDHLRAENTTGPDGVAGFDATPNQVTVRKPGFCISRSDFKDRTAKEHRVELTPGIVVRGRVVDADTRAPIEGVRVLPASAVDFMQTTAADGGFELAGMKPDHVLRLFAARQGFKTAFVVVQGEDLTRDVEIVLGYGGVVEGTVFGTDGRPMPDATVYLLHEDMDPPEPGEPPDEELPASLPSAGFRFPGHTTNSSGRFEIRGSPLPEPSYSGARVVVARDAEGRIASSKPVTFKRHGERLQRDIRFLPYSSLTVRGKDSAPLPLGTRIKVRRTGSVRTGPGEREIDDESRSETFEGLEPGTYVVSVELGRRSNVYGFSFEREVTVAAGERAVAELALGGNHRIEGTVVDAAGRPVTEALLSFEVDAGHEGRFSTWTSSNTDGSFEFNGLAPLSGTIRLRDIANTSTWTTTGDDTDASFAALCVQAVKPGGPAPRLVVQRPGRVLGRFVPALSSRDVEAGFAGDDERSIVLLRIDEEGGFGGELDVVDRPIDLYLTREGYAPVVLVNRTLAPGTTFDIGEVRFESGLTFDGRLLDAEGNPLARALLYAADPWIDRSLRTDADGTFRLEHLPRVPLHLYVGETARTANWRLTIDPARTRGEFIIGAGVEVSGRVLAADGSPARKVCLQLVPAGARRIEHAGAVFPITDDDGRFSVHLQPGNCRVAEYGSPGARAVEPSSFEASAEGPNPPLELRLR